MHKPIMLVLAASSLAAAAACADALRPISPNRAAPSDYYAEAPWAETSDSVLIDFESVRRGTYLEFVFYRWGVRFPRWAHVREIGVDLLGNPDPWPYEMTPPISGKHMIPLGYYYPKQAEGDFSFAEPVTSVSLSVRATGPFSMKCYDAAGSQVGAASAPGITFVDYVLVEPERLVVEADGITRCRVTARGGSLDDFSFKRSRVAIRLQCVGNLGGNVVTRGGSITCRVQTDSSSGSGQPSRSVTAVDWLYTDSAGNVTRGPIDSLEWRGRMVTGGKMRVSAIVNGDTLRDSAMIVVQARVWPRIQIRARQQPYPAGHLPSPVAVAHDHHMGDVHADSTVLLHPFEIKEGPNMGWWYLEYPTTEFPLAVHINEAAFAAGSAWYNLQRGGWYHDSTSGASGPRCSASDIPVMRQRTREHEGLASGTQTSHADAARIWVQTTAPQPHVELERTMYHGPSSIGYTFEDHVFAEYYDLAHAMEAFIAPHKNAGGIVDSAIFPCYARPWFN